MIKASSEADAARVIDTIVLGFSADPIMRWLYPQPQEYLRFFPMITRLFGGRAFDHDSAYHLDGYIGSALWLPPGIHPDEEGLVSLLKDSLSDSILNDAFSLLEQMERFNPKEPCWHLAFIAVDPAHQSNGLGSRMLEHSLKACDKDRKIAYLESTNPANLPLYKRHGFELVGEMQAGSSPLMFPMKREPQQAS
jgi:ribosomal protein S18 acetylase RimI-like enzyme